MKLSKFYLIATITLSLIILCVTLSQAQVILPADMDKIMMIESSGNPLAYNKRTKAHGLFQITPICLQEWNNYHPSEQYSKSDLFNPFTNRKIAEWYLNVRIPAMLRYYGLAVTKEHTLIAYNFGIGNLVKGKALPEETINYLKKFKER